MRSILDGFFSHLGAEGVVPANTLKAYRSDLNQLATFLAERGIADAAELCTDDLHAYCAWLAARGYARATIARRVVAMRAFGAYLQQTGLLDHDPCADLRPPRVPRVPRAALTSEQILALRSLMLSDGTPDGWRDRAMLDVLLAGALRVGELVALDLDDLALAGATLTVGARTGKARTVKLPPDTVMSLAAYLQIGRPAMIRAGSTEAALFLNHGGQRLTRQGCWVVLKGYARRLDLAVFTPELLRQSVAAQWFAAGATVEEVRELLGHSVRRTTAIYRPTSPE
jgi:integrase/recombinase XerD